MELEYIGDINVSSSEMAFVDPNNVSMNDDNILVFNNVKIGKWNWDEDYTYFFDDNCVIYYLHHEDYLGCYFDSIVVKKNHSINSSSNLIRFIKKSNFPVGNNLKLEKDLSVFIENNELMFHTFYQKIKIIQYEINNSIVGFKIKIKWKDSDSIQIYPFQIKFGILKIVDFIKLSDNGITLSNLKNGSWGGFQCKIIPNREYMYYFFHIKSRENKEKINRECMYELNIKSDKLGILSPSTISKTNTKIISISLPSIQRKILITTCEHDNEIIGVYIIIPID